MPMIDVYAAKDLFPVGTDRQHPRGLRLQSRRRASGRGGRRGRGLRGRAGASHACYQAGLRRCLTNTSSFRFRSESIDLDLVLANFGIGALVL